MFTLYGETVLDPFAGTGTTSLAAMVTGRNSVSIDADASYYHAFVDRFPTLPTTARTWNQARLNAQRESVAEAPEKYEYDMQQYALSVRTKQERDIELCTVDTVETYGATTVVTHRPYTESGDATPQ
jgi:hypothetical protein